MAIQHCVWPSGMAYGRTALRMAMAWGPIAMAWGPIAMAWGPIAMAWGPTAMVWGLNIHDVQRGMADRQQSIEPRGGSQKI